MTPVPQPETKPAYVDPRDRLEVHHVVIAAALVALNHELVRVDARPSAKPLFIFRKSATADHDRLSRLIDEMNAEVDRTKQQWWERRR